MELCACFSHQSLSWHASFAERISPSVQVDKTDHLQSESFAFRRNARALKRHMWWQNWRMLAAIVGLCVFLLYVLVSLFCGIKLQCK